LVADIQTKYDDFIAANSVSMHGSSAQRLATKACKLALQKSLKSLVLFLSYTTPTDRAVLGTTGFILNKEENTPSELFPLKKFSVSANNNFGSVTVNTSKGAGTKYVLIESFIGAAVTSETIWQACPDGLKVCVISGLVSASRIWVRATSVGFNGAKIISAPISMIVP
jgi:hypothetical protein